MGGGGPTLRRRARPAADVLSGLGLLDHHGPSTGPVVANGADGRQVLCPEGLVANRWAIGVEAGF